MFCYIIARLTVFTMALGSGVSAGCKTCLKSVGFFIPVGCQKSPNWHDKWCISVQPYKLNSVYRRLYEIDHKLVSICDIRAPDYLCDCDVLCQTDHSIILSDINTSASSSTLYPCGHSRLSVVALTRWYRGQRFEYFISWKPSSVLNTFHDV